MPYPITNTGLSVPSSPRRTRFGAIALFVLFVVVGGVGMLFPIGMVALLAIVGTVGLCWLGLVLLRRAGLELWQALLLTAISGYMLLNYGFENLTIHIGGFPIIISYGLMYAALIFAAASHQHLIQRGLKEPAVVCVLILIVIAGAHLAMNIPTFGLMAIRDATMCLDGAFMLLGLAWAAKENSVVFVSKWLIVIFGLNMLYSFTQPWGEKLWGWSPESGVFLPVAILGNFNGIGDLLLAGALFCICVGGLVVKRPSWLMQLLIVGQFLGFAVAQVRRMYVAAAVVLLILILLGEAKKFSKLLILLPAAVLMIVLVTTLTGVELNGRIGPVNLDFFKDHVRSISNSEGTPGSAVESRFTMASEAFGHFLDHPIVGFGFGQPLLTEIDMTNGAVTRMPHDSSLSYLARLGLFGFVFWVAFHCFLLKRFLHALRVRKSVGDPRLAAFILWAFLFYILVMIASFVEAPFEFPSGAVPFYFLMGFALGLIRKHFPEKKMLERHAPAYATGMETI